MIDVDNAAALLAGRWLQRSQRLVQRRVQRNDLVHEPQSPNNVTNTMLDADQVGDDEGHAAVQENEEGDAEKRDTEKICHCLQRGCGRGKG